MMRMYTFGTNERVGNNECRKIGGEIINSKRSIFVHNHYPNQYFPESQNEIWKTPIKLEETWSILFQSNHVFVFRLVTLRRNITLCVAASRE